MCPGCGGVVESTVFYRASLCLKNTAGCVFKLRRNLIVTIIHVTVNAFFKKCFSKILCKIDSRYSCKHTDSAGVGNVCINVLVFLVNHKNINLSDCITR